MKFKILSGIGYSISAFVLSATLAQAGNDPACAGEGQEICDTLGFMLNARGKGCYRMMSVSPTGANGYRINCVVSSSSDHRATYTLQFSADQSSYTVN